MTWNKTWPVGSDSVKNNRTTGAQNTTYIDTTMKLDHFWNEANLEGRHNIVHMPKQETGGNPVDPTSLPTGLDGAVYVKKKTAIESPNNEDVQLFYLNEATINAVPDVPFAMQLLGIRACGLFDPSSGSIGQSKVLYSHNLNSQTDPTVGISRESAGTYLITFANELPSNKYLILGGATPNESNTSPPTISSTAFFHLNKSDTKTTTQFRFITFKGSTNTPIDGQLCWFLVFGG